MRGKAEQLCTTGSPGGPVEDCSPATVQSSDTMWSELSNQSTRVLKGAERGNGECKIFSNYPAVFFLRYFSLPHSFSPFIAFTVLFNWHLNFTFKVRQADGGILKKGLLKVSLG